jgi:signal transduction histidine kinase
MKKLRAITFLIILLIIIFISLINIIQYRSSFQFLKKEIIANAMSITEIISVDVKNIYFTTNEIEKTIIANTKTYIDLYKMGNNKEDLKKIKERFDITDIWKMQGNIYRSLFTGNLLESDTELNSISLPDYYDDNYIYQLDYLDNSYIASTKTKNYDEILNNSKLMETVNFIKNMSGFKCIIIENEDDYLVKYPDSITTFHFLEDSFVQRAIISKTTLYKWVKDDNLEIVRPIYINNEFSAVLKLYLSPPNIGDFKRNALNKSIFIYLGLFIFLVFYYLFNKLLIEKRIIKSKLSMLSERSYHFLENIPDALAIFDSDKNIVMTNNLFKITFHKELVDNLLNWNFNNKFFRIGDKKFLVKKRLIRDDILIIARDITDYEKLKEKIEIEKYYSMMGKYSAILAHELGNPLNGISMLIQQLLKDKTILEDRKYYEPLENIYKETNRLYYIIKEYLNFSKEIELNRSSYNILDVVKESLVMIQDRIDTKEISISLSDSLDFLIICDRDKIKQVFINLIKNSIEAVENNGIIKIYTDVSEDIRNIIIYDNGNGIGDKVKRNLFELFNTDKEDGIGIGLAVTKKIIEKHGWCIKIESKPEEFTKVIIIIESDNENK